MGCCAARHGPLLIFAFGLRAALLKQQPPAFRLSTFLLCAEHRLGHKQRRAHEHDVVFRQAKALLACMQEGEKTWAPAFREAVLSASPIR
jgi:hypothetical protein